MNTCKSKENKEISYSNNNKRIAKNTGILYIRMIFQLLISLYTSRVVLNVLGFSDYGIYNVVGGVVGMFGFLNGSMGTATNRFLTFELGRGYDKNQMQKVFTTSLLIHLFICLFVLILAETVGLWYLNNKLVIPEGREFATNVVYQCSIIASLVAIISVPYNAAIVSREKMGAFAYITTFEVLLYLLVALSLNFIKADGLIIYAILIVLVKLLIQVIYLVYCKKNIDEVNGEILFDKSLFKQMSSFALWIMNGSFAVVCYTQGLNLLLNLFFGPVVNAARGIAVQVQSKIMGFCSNFQMAIKPQITKQYAAGDYKYMHVLVYNASVYSVLLMFFFSFPLMLESSFILEIWLVNVPEYTQEFVILTLCIGIIESLRDPINTCIHATGKIKKFQSIEGTASLLVLPLAYISLHLGYKPTSVFIVHLLVFVLLQILRVFLVCPKIYMKKRDYCINVVFKSLMVIVPSILIIIPLKIILKEDNFYSFLLICISSSICVLSFTYCFILSKSQKVKIVDVVCDKIKSLMQ